MRGAWCLVVALQAVLLGETSGAAQTIDVRRADGTTTPLRVYAPAYATCPPVALISPGLGGSERGFVLLAEALAAVGWLAIVMGHRESGPQPLRAHLRSEGVHAGILTMLTDPALHRYRERDVDAALTWAQRACKAPFLALLGHSMGGVTAMLEAGAHDVLGVGGANRFDAYVAISPEGPGPVFATHAWRDIRKPVLMITGTRDQGIAGDWRWRARAYADLPAGCAWLGVIEGATHFNFADRGLSAATTTRLTTDATLTFLDSVRTGVCPVPRAQAGIGYEHK